MCIRDRYSANPYDAPFNEDGSYNTDITVGGVPLNIFENIDNNPSYINRDVYKRQAVASA